MSLEGYREVGLSHVMKMLPGFAFKSENFSTDSSEGMPLIRIRDLGSQTTACRYLGEYDETFVINDGDILVGMDGEFAAVRWEGGPALLNQRVLKLSTAMPDILDHDFLFYRVQPTLDELEQSISGTTVKHLSTKDFKRLVWNVPPLDEQRRIAEVLRSGDEALEGASRVISQARAVHSTETQFTFEEVASSNLKDVLASNGWRRVLLGQLFRERKEHGLPGLPVASVSIEQGLVLRTSLDRRVESELRPEAHGLARKGDIAYNMMRMWQGACGLAEADCLISPAYVVMVPTAEVYPQFAFHMLRSAPIIRLLRAYSQGVVDDRLRLYPNAFALIPINLPPLAIQREIAASFDAIADFIKGAEREKAALYR